MKLTERRRRTAAVLSLASGGIVVLAVAVMVLEHLGYALAALAGLAGAGASGWYFATSHMPYRIVAGAFTVAGAAVVVWAVLAVAEGPYEVLRLAILLVGTLLASVAGRVAVGSGRRTVFVRRQPPQRPVLVCNPRSGGGKVGRFGLDQRARAMGVEVVVLEEDDDLEQLAREAVDHGADCLGMAGGDGSQALVAAVAVDAGLPFVCVAAGTRNHFALDLGLDRDDPVSTLEGFTSGLVRRVDYATVRSGDEDRLFVNNVSMGVYATVVQQDRYRDNKTATAVELLPELLGSQAEPFDLSFDDDRGRPVDGAFVVMVSNNPYVLGATAGLGQRRAIDTGRLGVFAMSTATGGEAASLLALSAIGARRRSPHWHEFTTHRFEVRSRCGSAYTAIDGEALELATPLEFRTHPGGLLVMVPEDNPGAVRRVHRRNVGLDDLVAVARGEGPAGETVVVPQPAG